MQKTSKLHGPSTGRGWSKYFIIAGTPNEAKVTHILFYGGKEASERWTALKDQVEGNKDDSDTMFKAFANSFEKSSSHWQARDEYLSDIKQSKHQTTAELDIYIKDLIRRCQFPQEDQESCKIDLLYMLLLTLRLGSLFTMPSQRSSSMTV